MKKIALIREKVNRYGGAEKNVWFLARSLRERGHEVHVFASAWDNAIDGVIYHQVKIEGGVSFLKPLFFAQACEKALKGIDFDVVHSFDRTIVQDVYRAGDGCHREWLVRLIKERKIWNRPFIYLNPKNLALLSIERKLFAWPGLKKIIANSRLVKDNIIRHYNVSPEKIEVIYNGIERVVGRLPKEAKINIRKKLGFCEDDYIVLFVGTNYERKGLRYVIESLKDVPEAKLVVVGKGKEAPYRKLAKGLGVDQRVYFFGFQKDITDFYSAADIFVFPTLYDPFSNVTLEAMAYGLPVLTTPANGASEIIVDGKEGYVVDPQCMSDKIDILRNEDLRDSLSRNACEKARMFSVEGMIDNIVKVYDQVVKDKLG